MFRNGLFLLNILLLFATELLAAPLVNLNHTEQEYSLAGKVEYLVDPSHDLLLEDVRMRRRDFSTIAPNIISLGYTNDTHWFYFRMKNSLSEANAVMILFDKSHLDFVSFYAIDVENGRLLESVETGDQVPFQQRALDHRDLVFPLTLNGNQEVAVYFKIRTLGTLSPPLTIKTQKQFFTSDSKKQLGTGIFYGILFVMISYNFLLYLILKERSYLYFLLYYITASFFELLSNGIFFEYLWPEFPQMNNMSIRPFFILLTVFDILFTQHFLSTKKQAPAMHMILRALLYTCVVVNLLFTKVPQLLHVVALVDTLIHATIFVSAILCYRRGYHPALYFILAWCTIIPDLLCYRLTEFGVIPYTVWTSYMGQVGTIGAMILLSLGLLDKVNVIKQEKKEAQALVIETQQKAQKKLIEKNEIIENKNEELKRLNDLKDDFLANTSHELRTPLNGIIGLTQSLIEEKKGKLSLPIVQDLRLIINSGKRLFLLINDILDIVRMEHSDLRIDKKSLNLHEIVENCAKIEAPWFQEKNIHWNNRVSPNIAVYADPDRLQQIILNLLSNALKFTFKGEISLSAIEKEKFVEIAVRDSGIGINKESQQRIFERFEKEKREINGGGVGLGLSITKSLVEKHGGTIWVESRVNQGSSFYFTLPVSYHPVEPVESSVSVASIHPDHSVTIELSRENGERSDSINNDSDRIMYKVLLVDDDPVNLASLINQLDVAEFSLQKASDGSEALDAIQENKPDIVLMDIMMGQLSGIDVCKRIRKKYGKLELPIIFQTCRDRDVDLKEALEAGGNDYITKPFSGVEIASRIHNHLNIAKESQQIPKPILEIIPKIDDVVYIQSSHDYACLYGYDNLQSIGEHYITLEKVLSYLGGQLIKINRSMLVKAVEVDSLHFVERKVLIRFKKGFTVDVECKLTQSNRKAFKERFPNLL